MGWFKRKTNPAICRVDELNSEIKQLEQQISSLQEISDSSDFGIVHQNLEKINANAEEESSKAVDLLPNEPRDVIELEQTTLYNNQGVRKFDLHGWWQRIKQNEALPVPSPNEKLVTYLATGRSHGYTALRKETRIARNRFILLTIVLIGVLWSILSLLIPQL
mgnify:CR=1 FL=1